MLGLIFVLGVNITAPTTTNIKIVVLGAEVEVVKWEGYGVPIAFVVGKNIGVNEEFLTFPTWFQDVLIAHEIGHIELNHSPFDNIDRGWYSMLWGTAPPNEIEADLYAADLLGADKVWEALIYSYQACVATNNIECAKEVLARIDMLEGRYCR